MNSASNSVAIGLLLSCLLLARPARGEDVPDKRQLIEGALARSKAIVSGRIRYRLSRGLAGKAGVLIHKSDGSDEVVAIPDTLVSIVFSGTSWRASVVSVGVKQSEEMANHCGAYLNFTSIPQPDGSSYHSAEIYPPRDTKALGDSIGATTFAGTFWDPQVAKFVSEHAEEAQVKDSTEIDGAAVNILEWSIPKGRIGNSLGPTPSWMGGVGGILRISVAPSLGYALPRIEYLTADRRPGATYASSSFAEVAPGVFFPNRCECQDYQQDSTAGWYYRIQFEEVSHINEPIADEEFVISVPGDTRVSDYRDPLQPIHFLARQAAAAGTPDVSEVVQFGTERPASVPGWRRWQTLPMAILLGVNIGVVGLLGYYIWRRRRARSES